MKIGYRILIHKSIPQEWMNYALKACDRFKQLADSEEGWKTRRDSCAFYRRGVLGYSLPYIDPVITFKRLVKNRRIFGVVPIQMLERKDGEPLELDRCMCGVHRGGVRVNLKGGFIENDYNLYIENGDIKG